MASKKFIKICYSAIPLGMVFMIIMAIILIQSVRKLDRLEDKNHELKMSFYQDVERQCSLLQRAVEKDKERINLPSPDY